MISHQLNWQKTKLSGTRLSEHCSRINSFYQIINANEILKFTILVLQCGLFSEWQWSRSCGPKSTTFLAEMIFSCLLQVGFIKNFCTLQDLVIRIIRRVLFVIWTANGKEGVFNTCCRFLDGDSWHGMGTEYVFASHGPDWQAKMDQQV